MRSYKALLAGSVLALGLTSAAHAAFPMYPTPGTTNATSYSFTAAATGSVVAYFAGADAGDTGPDWVANVCLLKNHSTQTMQFCADQAVQILGGMGFMRGTRSERIYREVKVMMIGGGAEEVMKELAARQLGL